MLAQFAQLERGRVEIWGQSIRLHVLRTPACFSVRSGHTPALLCPISGLGERPSPWPQCSPGEQRGILPFKSRVDLFLSWCSVFMLLGLDCTSCQLMVSWDRSYRRNHSNLTFGKIGQFPLLWTPSLTSNIARSTWAVSQSLKGFLLYRHLCCNGICCDGIWAV